MTADAIRTIIFDTWRSTFPRLAFDPARSLADEGADSLKVMGMVLRLERALGRAVPIDLLHAETSAGSLAAGLTETAHPTGSVEDDRRCIHYLPGIVGDQPMMATIRHALEQTVRFELIGYPSDHDSDMAAFAQAIAAQIAAAQPTGPISIAGYSFGALLAFEVARALQAQGREIALLILFDAIPVRSIAQNLAAIARRPDLATRKLRTRVRRLQAGLRAVPSGQRMTFLARWSGFYALGVWANRRAAAHDPGAGDRAIRMQGAARRAQAIRGWQPAPLDVSTLLIVSDDGVFAGIERLWTALIPHLTIARVPVSHGGLAEAGALGRVVAAVQSFVTSAKHAESFIIFDH